MTMAADRIVSCPCPPFRVLDSDHRFLLSIIIPAHNAAATLKQCLTALFEQDVPRQLYEVIVIDDASTDHTCTVAEGFDVQLIALKQNMGAARARNYAADQALGEYIFFLDADVILVRNSLPSLLALIEKERPDAVVGSYTVISNARGFFSQFQNFFTYFNHDQPPGPIHWFWTAMGVIRREVFIEMGGFSTRYRGASAEDMDLGYRLADAGKLTLLTSEVRGEHLHHHSLTSILRNDFRKSAAWGELYLRTNRSGEYHHTFTGWISQATLFGVWLMLAMVVAGFLWSLLWWAALGMFVFLVLLNIKFYAFIARRKGILFTFLAVLFHLFTYIPTGMGSIKALWRYLRHRKF